MKRMREWERSAQEDEERRRRERARRVEWEMEQMLREEARGRDQVMEGYRRFWQRARETHREFQNLEDADSEPEALMEARWVIRHARERRIAQGLQRPNQGEERESAYQAWKRRREEGERDRTEAETQTEVATMTSQSTQDPDEPVTSLPQIQPPAVFQPVAAAPTTQGNP